MTPNEILWATSALCLGVVLGVRVAVWWFTKVRPANARITNDISLLRAMPADNEEELPYRPPAEPYRFTYDTALRDLKPAVPPTAQVAGEPEPPPATTGLPFGDQLGKYPN